MDHDDLDGAEVDRLLQELKSRPRAPKPAVTPPPTAAVSPPAPAASATAAPAQATRVPVPGRRWSTARLLMPAVTITESKRTFAFASALRVPALPHLGFPALTERQSAVFAARLFVALGGFLGTALPYWPYANACSWGLGFYLSAVLLVLVTGVWGAKLTWDAHLGAAHALALCIVFWGLTLVAAAVLPRVGYAQVQEAWFCA